MSYSVECKQYLFHILLLLSADVQSNPGPRVWKYPCKYCGKPVKANQQGICCDLCNTWHHLNCLPEVTQMSETEYEIMGKNRSDWYCFECHLPPFSDSFFGDTGDSDSSCGSDIEGPDSIRNVLENFRMKNPKDLIVSYLNYNKQLTPQDNTCKGFSSKVTC